MTYRGQPSNGPCVKKPWDAKTSFVLIVFEDKRQNREKAWANTLLAPPCFRCTKLWDGGWDFEISRRDCETQPFAMDPV
jgi:hypothetical protein